MSEPYVGEIRMFGGNFAPLGWAFCNGQLLTVSTYPTLFSLIGTLYGGDGVTTFALPNLQSRIPIHYGSGGGLSNYPLGSSLGVETVTLTEAQMPTHNHGFPATTAPAQETSPNSTRVMATGGANTYRNSLSTPTPMNRLMVPVVGGSQPHSNLMPFLCINFIIALDGIYPTRN